MDTGAKIKQLRESLDMTQEELGKILGVKKAAINKYETGTVVNLKRSTIETLCNIFNVTPQYLLSDSDFSDFSPSSSMQLTEQEEHLVTSFRGLNEEGREKAVERVEELLDVPRYQMDAVSTRIWQDAEKVEKEIENVIKKRAVE